MSLLLDALKRAEQEKSAREGAPAPAAAAPAPPRASANLELQPLGGGHTTAGISAAPRGNEAHGAQALFEAKQATQRAADARARGPLLAAIGAIAVIVLAAGAYVWFSIQSLAPRAPVASAPLRPPAAPTPPPASGAPYSGAAVPAAATTAPPSPAATLREVPAAATRPPPATENARAAAPGASTATVPALSARPITPEAPAVQLSRGVERPAVPPHVAGGYDALRRGDLVEARTRYEAAVAADPASVDANLGLATVDARAGRISAAATSYRRVLQLDPRNATALAGLAALADFSRPEDLETQLRADIAKHPGSAPLHATLGNLYAAQSRWTEAQSEYFEAHRLQPGSADTLYNLAVSLDHLGQARLAHDYYARSLEAARGQATQFDPDRVSRRLAELRR